MLYRLQIFQASGSDGRYSKLKVTTSAGTDTIELTHELLGQLISGVAVEAAATHAALPRTAARNDGGDSV